MTSALPPLPPPPDNVRYALTVPQSVLFAELSLDGSRRWAFREAMGLDYEPAYIAIDNGAMSWACDEDPAFTHALGADHDPERAARRFLDGMTATARTLDLASRWYPSSAGRRGNNVADVIEDLEAYWRAYRLHMTSLFTFWNAEALVSSALVQALKHLGRSDDIAQGLARFFRASQENYFVGERRQLRRLAKRFPPAEGVLHEDARAAFQEHSRLFGFLLAPFNLGAPPSAEDIRHRVRDLPDSLSSQDASSRTIETFEDLPSGVRPLAVCAQHLAFWKTERLDGLFLADDRALPLFEETADLLRITPQQLFAMTRPEILDSLRTGDLQVPPSVLARRTEGFCLALVNGSIAFYAPTHPGAGVPEHPLEVGESLCGIAASEGEITAQVRIVQGPDDSALLEPGEVLVTRMTRPEMGVALDRAAAFVTDEGGLMCHAAILSRELKKPCIIGTGCATQKLATGDRVRVQSQGTEGRVTLIGKDGSL